VIWKVNPPFAEVGLENSGLSAIFREVAVTAVDPAAHPCWIAVMVTVALVSGSKPVTETFPEVSMTTIP